jgi:nucleoside-diphosphate-sugar epimerase
MSKKVVMILGSEGFIGSYVVSEFLKNGYDVIGIDDLSKYGLVKKKFHDNINYRLFVEKVQNEEKLRDLIAQYRPQYILNFAGIIGGIGYFNARCYDLISENEAINNSYGELLKYAYHELKCLKKCVWLSSSMIFGGQYTTEPSKEDDWKKMPPPLSAYGFQKLANHYYAESLFEQYKVPYLVIIPFNAIGIGEIKPMYIKDLEESTGEKMIAYSHVIPDFICKYLSDPDKPLDILGTGKQVRSYTAAKDIAEGVRLLVESDINNETFNIGISEPIDCVELGRVIHDELGIEKPYEYNLVPGLNHDIQYRCPDVSKAKEMFGFEAKHSLRDILRTEIIPWFRDAFDKGEL